MKLPLPALTWLRSYDRAWLRGDLVAAVTLAAYVLPAALGDASLASLPPDQLVRLTQIDYDREMAFILEMPAPDATEIIAVGRLAIEPDRRRAEFAVAVRSDLKGRGFGRLLLARLVDYARKTGVFDVPADYKLEVVQTPPPLESSVDGASYYPAPPFKNSGIGRFYVTPTHNDQAALQEHQVVNHTDAGRVLLPAMAFGDRLQRLDQLEHLLRISPD